MQKLKGERKKSGPPAHPSMILTVRLVKPMIMSKTKDGKKIKEKMDDRPPTH